MIGPSSPVTPSSAAPPPEATLPKSGRARLRAGTVGSDVEEQNIMKKGRRSDPSAEEVLAKMRASKEFFEDAKFMVALDGKLHCNLCGVSFGTRMFKLIIAPQIATKRSFWIVERRRSSRQSRARWRNWANVLRKGSDKRSQMLIVCA